MSHLDGGDNGNIGLDHAGERPQLARMVHADLENPDFRGKRQARQRQRHAPMIVEAAGIGEGLGLAGKGETQRFLGAGLADAARDADEPRLAARPASAAQASQREKRIVHHEQAGVRRKTGRPAMGHGRDRALGERGRDEIMAIETRSRETYEQIARLQGAAVDGNAGRLPRAGRLPARGAGDVGRCPERGHASSFTAARASSLSSKGCVMPAIV